MKRYENKVKCSKCGCDLVIVVAERENGRMMFDQAETQSRGTLSTLKADGTWDYYCKECFLKEALRLFKGKIVEEQ